MPTPLLLQNLLCYYLELQKQLDRQQMSLYQKYIQLLELSSQQTWETKME